MSGMVVMAKRLNLVPMFGFIFHEDIAADQAGDERSQADRMAEFKGK